MDDLEEFESWHNDLMAWECFQNEFERIEEEENTSGDLQDIDENDIFLSSRIYLCYVIGFEVTSTGVGKK